MIDLGMAARVAEESEVYGRDDEGQNDETKNRVETHAFCILDGRHEDLVICNAGKHTRMSSSSSGQTNRGAFARNNRSVCSNRAGRRHLRPITHCKVKVQ
jgi:hypothetical protein